MFDDLTISAATISDVPQLVQLVNSAYRGESSKKGWTTEADLLGGIRIDETSLTDLIKRPGACLLKCTNNRGEFLGCVYLHHYQDEMYLGMLTVSPESQASGIGKQLLEASEEYARQEDCKAITMTVISIRNELIAWYERRGFHLTGEKQPFPNDPRFGIPKQPLEFVVMKKKLIHNKHTNQGKEHITQSRTVDTMTDAHDNPLLKRWEGPYGGVPPFDSVEVPQFKPALEAAMADNLDKVKQIASNAEAPTFDNTIAAMERADRTFRNVHIVYNIWSANMNSPEFQLVEREMGPKIAAFSDQIIQNEQLFQRIEAVYQSPEKAKLTPEQQRLTWHYYNNFVRAGAKLNAADKARLSQINQQLARQFTRFSQNVLADESEQYVVLQNEADLEGLPQSARDVVTAAVAAKKITGVGIITNTRSSVAPFLTYSSRRDLREKVWRMFISRGDNGGEHDNNAISTEILQLRAQRAQLLGYPTHAHWRLENTMAKTPEKAMELMEAVWKPAVARVQEEVADMQQIASKDGVNKIEPWDYSYYGEKVRKAKYDLDQDEVKQYLQLEQLREGMFWVAGELFGFSFTLVSNIPVYHPDVRVWDVKDKTTGRHVGLWYFDPYTRTGKKSGAWMNAYRRQEQMDEPITTIVSNNSNFVKGKPGEPVLISWDDASTLFHEFGHALHGLSSNVTYGSLAGTAVFRDYVEFPSQLLEHWLSTPEVLQRFALHYKTGKPIPKDLVEKIEKASTFQQGFATTEYLASGLIDMKIHLAGTQKIDPDAFERETLAQLGMPSELVMRHRLPHFLHIFSSDSYSAGYYSYLWSDVITADAYGAFTEAGGPYDKVVARRLYEYVFSVGNTIDPTESYRLFRGRDAKIDGLMQKRGFPINNVH
ncbi:GNAT family N-acetyltransferase [Chitinophagaceae bacterium LB-8]|uniref:GNAT family N-acetyltransferase n=1 Tax=Paraflavisolibacter caeni TaxID=2982496 RepID=A0A9X2XVW7_9BACT|nr:GNAT family N-acetyltransferase [Paraflavisolibacter caeni]MCU7548658.1 GNAT family N-acetyltransferase [Paraflavisolibacter caeni]